MILDRLHIDQVRIVTDATLDFSPKLNLVVGPNGAGKTSILEAAHLLVRGRSFRRGNLDDLINYDADAMRVQGVFQDPKSLRGTTKLEFSKSRGTSTTHVQTPEWDVPRSDLGSQIPVQAFLPDAAELILGPPELRRHWLDSGLLHTQGESLRALTHFRQVLRQRNAVLRHRQHGQLDVWDFELGASGDALTNHRQQHFEAILPYVHKSITELCPEVPISLDFYKGFTGTNYVDALAKQRLQDVKLGTTNQGPHRADIQLKLEVEGSRRRSPAGAGTQVSRGQARALSAALLLAQSLYLCTLKQASLLLVDDLGSELDRAHNERLLQLMSATGNQIIASMVTEQALPERWQDDASTFRLSAGQVTAASS